MSFSLKISVYQESENFVAFGYDWRRDVRETATQLGRLLRTKAEEGKQEFRILAHSMGGVIVRLMLADSAFSDIAARTSLFLQIGSPVSGASSAYYSTKQFPQIHALLTFLIQMAANMDKLVRHELLTTLASFQSLFQMMPPEDKFLVNGTEQFSTFSEGVWKNQYAAYLASAMETHTRLRSSAFERMKIIYGYDQATHDKYAVTKNFRIHEVLEPQNGDGTVGVQSATSFANDDQILAAVDGVPHDELPNCRVVLDLIAKELAV